MRWKAKPRIEYKQWTKFAWRPVRVGGHWIWLERVACSKTLRRNEGETYYIKDYFGFTKHRRSR